MVVEAVRGYAAVASGLGEMSRRRAQETARALLAQAPSAASAAPLGRQVQQLADDLLATARSNRVLLEDLVRGEVVRAAESLGLVRGEAHAVLASRVTELERQVAVLRQEVGAVTRAASEKPAAKRSAATKATAKRSAATKTTAKRSAATKTTAKPATAATRRAATARGSAASDA